MILVTGGAGYIGSHIVKGLLEKNYIVLVLDNFSTGFIEPLQIMTKNFNGLSYVNCDLADTKKLKEIFLKNEIEAVIHLAAKIDVTESLKKPDLYVKENFLNSINLVEAMTEAGVNKLIFSSTAAVYGNPVYTPIDENHPVLPLNHYGQTKLDFEKYLGKCQNLKYVIFRYFNVGGSAMDGNLGKSHLNSQDLIENIIKTSLGQQEYLEVFGSDYDTSDGMAIRDFVHVEDIASAHILALEKINECQGEVFNLGSEKGFSVKEIIAMSEEVTGENLNIKYLPRREGDISVSIASAKKVKSRLGWEMKNSTLSSIITSDWHWRKDHPEGYKN